MKLFDVYPLFDINITKGKGCRVWDNKGNEYLDLYGGHAVISVGHCHPVYVEAIRKQSEKLSFYSNSVINDLQQKLAEKIGEISGYNDYSLFLVNSGAEANENALKLASFHTGRKRIISFSKAFHGRTSATVDATDNDNIKAPINKSGNVTFIKFNDYKLFRQEIEKGDVAAVIYEPIQGVGGIMLPQAEFIKEVRTLTKKYGTVLIADEIQCGYGRTGKFFAHQWTGITPDLITVAKGIANGFPMGGVLISPEFAPRHGMLGTTFGGNHLACAAACAVIDIFQQEKLIDNALFIGEYLLSELTKQNNFKEIRGKGLMIGIEGYDDVSQLRKDLIFEQNIFTGASGKNIIRLLPPLVLTKNDADIFLERLSKQTS